MNNSTGTVIAVNGNMVSAKFSSIVSQNEIGYVYVNDTKLKAEVIRIRNDIADLQVFEDSKDIRSGDQVFFSNELLNVELGPGLIGMIFDGLQNPLPELAEKCGFFLKRGVYLDGLERTAEWEFTPSAEVGQMVSAGHNLGTVPETIITHIIKVPFLLKGNYKINYIAPKGTYKITECIAKLSDSNGQITDINMLQKWPVKVTNKIYSERLPTTESLITGQRIIDTFFPVNKGGTYCIPGPFGAGKTVLQQITSRYADVDIVIIAACGERAGEVVDTLREFPQIEDPRTGKSLMERTIIICNTSSMPVAAREASVYTAVSLGEYYRSMGLDILLLADSTSRWAQALREMSGRLEEIPGEEAFPAYLESRIAQFYERAGRVRNIDGSIGSLTIGGTVSPAGGNFNEPVTQSTLKVVKAFHGLSRARSDARRFPAIDPLDSWSKSEGIIDTLRVEGMRKLLIKGNETSQMMTVVGQEGISTEEYTTYLKSEIVDRVYLQQNAFNEIDASCSAERQKLLFGLLEIFVKKDFKLPSKEEVRDKLFTIQEAFLRLNYQKMGTEEFQKTKNEIETMLGEDISSYQAKKLGDV
ncbi:MAG: V-type ATP synthase subunit A [bacterium]